MVLYHASDLLWATRIKATADACGVPVRPVRSVEMLRSRLEDSPVRALIVDLDAPDTAMELLGIVCEGGATGEGRGITTLAFGPHVAGELFLKAKEAGASVLMARGAFSARLGDILRNLEAGGRPANELED